MIDRNQYSSFVCIKSWRRRGQREEYQLEHQVFQKNYPTLSIIATIYHIFCDANLPINIIVSFISIPCHNHNNKTMRDFLMCHQWDFAVSILFIGECSQIWRYIIRGVTRFAIFVPNPPLQDAEFDWANFTRPAYQKPCDTF